MRQIKTVMDDGGVLKLNDVKYIQKLRKILISLGTLHKKGFFYMSDGDSNIMKVRKCALTVMREMRYAGNISKL